VWGQTNLQPAGCHSTPLQVSAAQRLWSGLSRAAPPPAAPPCNTRVTVSSQGHSTNIKRTHECCQNKQYACTDVEWQARWRAMLCTPQTWTCSDAPETSCVVVIACLEYVRAWRTPSRRRTASWQESVRCCKYTSSCMPRRCISRLPLKLVLWRSPRASHHPRRFAPEDLAGIWTIWR
jgi:hypothetical protein